MKTIRKNIPGWEGYQAGSDGTIWSCRGWGCLMPGWHQLKPGRVGKYLSVGLCGGRGTGVTGFYVHQLILMSFVGPCPPGMETIHLNDDQHDNRLSNLEWGTHKRNCELRRSNGKEKVGEQLKQSKLTEECVRWIRRNSKKRTMGEMGRMLKVCTMTISDVLKGITWKHVK